MWQFKLLESNNDLSDVITLNAVPSSNNYMSTTSSLSLTIKKTGFIFALNNSNAGIDTNHYMIYTRNGINSDMVCLSCTLTPYPVTKGDIVTIYAQVAYASIVYTCGCV